MAKIIENNRLKMKRLKYICLVLVGAIFLTNCDMEQYRADAIGTFGEVIVIMDSTDYKSQTAEAIRSTFGRYVHTIPDAPRFMTLRFRSFSTNNELERLKKFKNIIIAAPISGQGNTARLIRALLGENAAQQVKAGNEFAFILQNQWYDDQWLLILTAPSDKILAQKIKQAEERLTQSLLQKEFGRWITQVNEDAEQFKIEEHLWQNYGWKIRVKHDWSPHLDTAYVQEGIINHLFTMQRITDENDRRFWAWWVNKPINVDTLSVEDITQLRNEIWKKWFRGSRDSTYVTTSFRRPVVTDTLKIDGHIAYETRGVWRLKNAVMAGPFVSMFIYDENTERIFMVGFLQFAPSIEQRAYVRQFRAMLRTFESDSTFKADGEIDPSDINENTP